MNQTKNFTWIIAVIALCVLGWVFYNLTSNKSVTQQTPSIFSDEIVQNSDEFSDGLNNPDSVTTYPLDEFETGISEKSVYMIDINNDGKNDRITKTFFENWNAHSYYEYKIELNKNGKYIDITPKNLRTVNGADCDLQQIQFVFKPKFKVIMIYREMGDTWIEPTMATKRIYSFDGDTLNPSYDKNLRTICDVKELF